MCQLRKEAQLVSLRELWREMHPLEAGALEKCCRHPR